MIKAICRAAYDLEDDPPPPQGYEYPSMMDILDRRHCLREMGDSMDLVIDTKYHVKDSCPPGPIAVYVYTGHEVQLVKRRIIATAQGSVVLRYPPEDIEPMEEMQTLWGDELGWKLMEKFDPDAYCDDFEDTHFHDWKCNPYCHWHRIVLPTKVGY